MALGELIIEDRGKITGQRVLDVKGPKTETSFTMQGKYKGAEGTDVGTYASVPKRRRRDIWKRSRDSNN